MDHFVSTLNDRDLAKKLTILRLSDAIDMEVKLRAYQRTENRYTKASMDRASFISDLRLMMIRYGQNQPEKYERSGWKARAAVRSRIQVDRKRNLTGAGFVRSTSSINETKPTSYYVA